MKTILKIAAQIVMASLKSIPTLLIIGGGILLMGLLVGALAHWLTLAFNLGWSFATQHGGHPQGS